MFDLVDGEGWISDESEFYGKRLGHLYDRPELELTKLEQATLSLAKS